MEKQWRSAALSAQTGQAKIEQSVLDGVKEIIENIKEQCIAQKDASKDLMQVRKDAIKQCGTDKDTANRELGKIWNILREKGQEHFDCTHSLCFAEQQRIDEFARRDQTARDAHAAIPECSEVAAGGETCATDVANCETCLNKANDWYGTWHDTLDTQIDFAYECERNSTKWQQDCDRLSHVYEEDWCEYKDEVKVKCDLYDKCYTDTAAAYDADMSNLTEITDTNIQIHVAANEVKCWIDVISTCQGDQAHNNAYHSSSTDVGACRNAKDNCQGDAKHDEWYNQAVADLMVQESSPRYELRTACDETTLDWGYPGDQSWEDEWYYNTNTFHDPICTTFPQFKPVVTRCQHFSFTVGEED